MNFLFDSLSPHSGCPAWSWRCPGPGAALSVGQSVPASGSAPVATHLEKSLTPWSEAAARHTPDANVSAFSTVCKHFTELHATI